MGSFIAVFIGDLGGYLPGSLAIDGSLSGFLEIMDSSILWYAERS